MRTTRFWRAFDELVGPATCQHDWVHQLGEEWPAGAPLLRRAGRIAMALAHAVAHVDEVQMRVDLDYVDRRLLGERAHAGDVHRMVAAQNHRNGAALEDLAHRRLSVAVAGGGVRMHHVSVANVDDAHFVGRQVHHVVLVVVGAAVAEGEESRGLANRARPETGAGAVLRAHVEGNAENRDIRVEAVPVQAGGPLAERAVADERKVEPALLVCVHSFPPCAFAWQ